MPFELMAPLMFAGLVVFLLLGYPVAFSLAANGLLFGIIGIVHGSIEPALDVAISTLSPFSGEPKACVLGRAERFDVLHAALLNGIGSHVHEYDDTLPSLNMVWDITDDMLLRFGAAKVVARPGLGNLTPGVTVSVSGGNRTVTGGDPLLDPFRAKTADLSWEWYFAEESLLGVALFYKDIETFVQTRCYRGTDDTDTLHVDGERSAGDRIP